MASKKINEFTTSWISELKACQEHRQKHTRINQYQDYRRMYRGDWREGYIAVNRIFSFGRALVPNVYFRAPRVVVTETRPEFAFEARVVEAVDNYLIQETMLKETIKEAVLIAFLNGTCPIKIGYDSEFGYDPSWVAGPDGTTITQLGRTEDRRVEYKTNIKPGMPWALADQPENVITPIGYKRPQDLPWVAHRIIRPLDDVKQDHKYKNTKDLAGTRIADLNDLTPVQRSFLGQDNEFKWAELWEIRDYRDGTMFTICEDELILSSADELQIEGLPWDFLIFNPDPEQFDGIPDVKMIEQQQIELNEIRTQARGHRGIALLKFLYAKGALSPKALDQLLSGSIGPAVEVDAETIAGAIQILQPHIPPDLAIEAQNIRQDMRETLGQGENQVGAFSTRHNTTATEAMEVAAGADLRQSERKDIVADLMIRIVRKYNQYIFKFWNDRERVAKIVGPSGADHWVSYTGEMLAGEYNLKIDPDSGFPISKGLRMNMANGLMATLGGDPSINQQELRRLYLQQFEFAFPGIGRALLQLPVDLAQELAHERQPGMGEAGGGSRVVPLPQGRGGSTAEQPQEFEAMKARFQEGKI